jgi:hypothetical protein
MTLTTAQWATAVRPLLDRGIIEVPGWVNREGVWWMSTETGADLGIATALDRLAFLAVIEGKLVEHSGADCCRGNGMWGWWMEQRNAPPICLSAEHDRETAALRAAYAQWPELGGWPL